MTKNIPALKAINDLNRHIQPLQSELNAAVSRVIASGWFVLGSEVKAFEQEFASYCGVQHCVTLANGTDALELALRSLNISKNSKVLTVANAGMYSTAAILATRATPVYADIDAGSLLIDVADATRLITSQHIDTIIVTHLYGLLADVQQLVQLANSKNIPVIEDCAQAHGAMFNEKKAGSFGDIACFSFYPTKNLGALGDGGAVVTHRDDLAQRVRQLRQYGWESKYCATLAGGRNSRLDEMQAAILRIMLPLLDGWNARRREIATQYSKGISHEKIVTPTVHGEEYVAHLYVIKTTDRDSLKRHLSEAGIPSDIHYPIPDYRQPAYAHLFPEVSEPVTEQQCTQVLTLPCFPEMTDAEVDMVINCINTWK
ncbi:DegT/DnrJ/EryC1/StrS family aminotransferase [Methylobacter tundripaludum]|uniref:DegT/DnrJ/EryC1/StrS aminotransferase n=1 Tax=Methylobacter tundripaludum (strain ATCC BAA-1195 / DSM 17260 / SV96) TaxID=697282 RepID=G3IVU0_METTV|nr:DegT/DnrJ/EryC1/StrS family aminotransferase [Methylobacter tundripaludum]EGW22947.1 DegT/DnrJ/EryC1/StrS aminotransferase [Methylobacter tundripaludum SV96]